MRYLTGKHLSRRTLLRGAGAALALPLLESMIPAGVRDASAAGVPRSRLACIYIPHGCVMSRWMPSAAGREFELQPTLQSLEPFRERLEHRERPEAARRRTSASRPRPRITAARRNAGSRACREDTGPSPTSVDQVAARHVGQDTPLPSLELALEAGSSISYLTPRTPLPMETNPRVVFERLLGDGSTPAERAARQRQLSSLLDSVDGRRRRVEARSARRGPRAHGRLSDGRARARAPARARGRFPARHDRRARQAERHPGRLRGARDADVRPARARVDRGPHANRDVHGRARAQQSALSEERRERRASTTRRITRAFRRTSTGSRSSTSITRARRSLTSCGKLADTPDGDGSLLDHSIVVYGSGMGNPNQHDHDPLPMLLAGGGSGRLQGGRHVRVADGTPVANLLVTRARQARRAGRVVRRQHGRARDLMRVAPRAHDIVHARGRRLRRSPRSRCSRRRRARRSRARRDGRRGDAIRRSRRRPPTS